MLNGCTVVTLNPIETTDIIYLEEGDNLQAPKKGFFLSEFYYDKVLKAKIK